MLTHEGSKAMRNKEYESLKKTLYIALPRDGPDIPILIQHSTNDPIDAENDAAPNACDAMEVEVEVEVEGDGPLAPDGPSPWTGYRHHQETLSPTPPVREQQRNILIFHFI